MWLLWSWIIECLSIPSNQASLGTTIICIQKPLSMLVCICDWYFSSFHIPLSPMKNEYLTVHVYLDGQWLEQYYKFIVVKDTSCIARMQETGFLQKFCRSGVTPPVFMLFVRSASPVVLRESLPNDSQCDLNSCQCHIFLHELYQVILLHRVWWSVRNTCKISQLLCGVLFIMPH